MRYRAGDTVRILHPQHNGEVRPVACKLDGLLFFSGVDGPKRSNSYAHAPATRAALRARTRRETASTAGVCASSPTANARRARARPPPSSSPVPASSPTCPTASGHPYLQQHRHQARPCRPRSARLPAARRSPWTPTISPPTSRGCPTTPPGPAVYAASTSNRRSRAHRRILLGGGVLPVPQRGQQIAFGELIALVDRVQYSCMDAGCIATRDHQELPVKIDLRLLLTKATRQGNYEPYEFHSILSELPSVTDLCATGPW